MLHRAPTMRTRCRHLGPLGPLAHLGPLLALALHLVGPLLALALHLVGSHLGLGPALGGPPHIGLGMYKGQRDIIAQQRGKVALCRLRSVLDPIFRPPAPESAMSMLPNTYIMNVARELTNAISRSK